MFKVKVIIKKLFKTIASITPSNKFRILLYKKCGYSIGKQVYIAERLIIAEILSEKDNLFIGDRVAIGPGVFLLTSSDPNYSRIRPYVKNIKGRIIIKNDAWIGAGAIILPDLIIGEGAIVGAGAVVTKNVDPFTIVAGVPAKKIGEVK